MCIRDSNGTELTAVNVTTDGTTATTLSGTVDLSGNLNISSATSGVTLNGDVTVDGTMTYGIVTITLGDNADVTVGAISGTGTITPGKDSSFEILDSTTGVTVEDTLSGSFGTDVTVTGQSASVEKGVDATVGGDLALGTSASKTTLTVSGDLTLNGGAYSVGADTYVSSIEIAADGSVTVDNAGSTVEVDVSLIKGTGAGAKVSFASNVAVNGDPTGFYWSDGTAIQNANDLRGLTFTYQAAGTGTAAQNAGFYARTAAPSAATLSGVDVLSNDYTLTNDATTYTVTVPAGRDGIQISIPAGSNQTITLSDNASGAVTPRGDIYTVDLDAANTVTFKVTVTETGKLSQVYTFVVNRATSTNTSGT